MSPPTSKPITPMDIDALATSDPLPDCRAPGFVAPDPHTRWLAFRGSKHFSDPPSVYVVRVDDHGPGEAYEMGPNFAGEGWNIGEWSDDGRYFGFGAPKPDNASFPGSSYVVDTRAPDHPVSWQVPGSGFFYHWAPHRSLFALTDHDGVHFMDAADHTRDSLIPAMVQAYVRLEWSADGRYGAITAEQQLRIVDLDAADLTQLAFMTASSGAPQWAPSGHRLIFVGAGTTSDQLMLLDLDAAHPKPAVLATAETTNEGAELVTRWLDSDRVLVWSPNRIMQIVDTKVEPPAIERLGSFDDQFQFLGGNRCLVYEGPCLPNGMTATCLVSLDPKANRAPRPVYPGQGFRMRTSAAGSPVLFLGPGELLVESRFDGTPYAPSYVTRPAATPAFRFFSDNPLLSDATDLPWVHFIAAPTSASESHSYFWNRKLDKLIDDVAPGLSFDDIGVFSPDGRDYAATARDVSQFPPKKLPLVIMRPHSAAPTEQWQLDVFALTGFAEFNMAWSR